jgi:glyoxylase-like metal-dependent hydrolase (beta-lactamase superfamily II)
MLSSDQRTLDRPNAESEGKVAPFNVGHVNVYLIETESGHILVDTGMPNAGHRLDEVFEGAGVDPRSVQLIVVTHGHMDHVGSIAYAQQITGAKALCHRSISDGLLNGEVEPAIPQNLVGRLLNLLTGLAGSRFKGTKPDVLVDDEFDLHEYGIAGKIIHTPGHSPSSVSIMLENGEALVGDLVRPQRDGRLGLGMFYEDKETLLKSLVRVADFEPKRIYLSHGTYTDSRSLRGFIRTSRRQGMDG